MEDVKNFEKEVLNSTIPVVVDFYADWCGPCKVLKNVYEKISKNYDNVSFVKVNVDLYPSLVSEYEIVSVPTTIIFKNGKQVKYIVGIIPEKDIKESIEELI